MGRRAPSHSLLPTHGRLHDALLERFPGLNTMSISDELLRFSSRTFDAFRDWWEGPQARRIVTFVLVGGFFVALLLIEASRQELLPVPTATSVGTNHFRAIDVAFTLFLVVELVGLVVGLSGSVSDTAGKQFEVFSLILLRESFKELTKFDEEPIQWTLDGVGREAVQLAVVDATGALLIFLAMGLFYRLQRREPVIGSLMEHQRFVAWKKLVANALLLVLAGLSMYSIVGLVGIESFFDDFSFFDTFYTVLIFSDILIVLVSLRYSLTYHVVFRSSGFAAATVMIRLALAGPDYVNAVLGVLAALFNVGVAATFNFVAPAAPTAEPEATDPGEEIDAEAEPKAEAPM